MKIVSTTGDRKKNSKELKERSDERKHVDNSVISTFFVVSGMSSQVKIIASKQLFLCQNGNDVVYEEHTSTSGR